MATFENKLLPAIEEALQSSNSPMDCAQLFELPAIKAHANSVSRVSDYLGNLWRKGSVERLPAASNCTNRARWRYQWRGDRSPTPGSISYTPRVLADRPTMLVTEEGSVLTVELPSLIISIRHKPDGLGR